METITDPLTDRGLAEEAIAGQRLMHERGDCSCGQIDDDDCPDIGCVLLAEVDRLRGAIEQHRETELARLESSGLDDDGKPLFAPMEHDEHLWGAPTERP